MSPVAYWPLGDPTGPAASEATHNAGSLAGVYGGTFSLGIPTFEFGGSTGLFVNTGGYVRCPIPFNGVNTYTVGCYASLSSFQQGAWQWLPAIGDMARTRGGAMYQIANYGKWLTILANGNTNTQGTGTGENSTLAGNIWNWFEWYWDNTGHTVGTVVSNPSVYSNTSPWPPLWPVAGDFVYCQPNFMAVMAHLVIWNRLLTTTEHNILLGHLPTWQYGPPLDYVPLSGGGSTSLSPTDPVVVDINADLSNIYSAVHHVYTNPPS
jgi:hypothetical protein